MKFTFGSWNINGNERVLERSPDLWPQYLRCLSSPASGHNSSAIIDIIALQEVRRSTFKYLHHTLENLNLLGWCCFSLPEVGPQDEWGCALLGSPKFNATSARLLSFGKDLETSEKFCHQTLIVKLKVSTGPQKNAPITVASFHVPNGSQHGIYGGDFKRRFGDAIATWLKKRGSRTIFGIDANSPELDHKNSSEVGLFKSDSRLLFGESPILQFLDAYRVHRSSHRRERPAYSYQKNRGFPIRADHIWTTEDFKIKGVEYGPLRIRSGST